VPLFREVANRLEGPLPALLFQRLVVNYKVLIAKEGFGTHIRTINTLLMVFGY
jgi:hypothetical protein